MPGLEIPKLDLSKAEPFRLGGDSGGSYLEGLSVVWQDFKWEVKKIFSKLIQI